MNKLPPLAAPLLGASLLLTTLSPSPADATIMLRLELTDLVGRADAIFVGVPVSSRSRWVGGGRQIVTDTTFRVVEAVRGARVGRRVVVRRLGGSVGGVGMWVSGTPRFRSGARVLLFTEQRAGHRFVVGMRQGAFHVHRQPDGRAMVRVDLGGLALAERRRDRSLRMLKRAGPAPRALSQFIGEIRQTIARCARERDLCRAR